MILGEMRSASIGWEIVVRSAQDRTAWRDLVQALCATGHDCMRISECVGVHKVFILKNIANIVYYLF